MSTIFFIFLIALSVTGFSTPWIRQLAINLGFVDAPAKRKLHSSPMPLMGGVAIFIGAAIAASLLLRNVASIRSPQVQGILFASTFMAVTGLIDDRRSLPAYAKFSAQIVACLILILFRVQVSLPLPPWVNYAITILWITGITNAVNLLDNMDGLSAGISAVSGAFILLIAALNDQYLVGGLAAAALGACLGFLRYNFKPAQIFMGDAGALFLGFLLGILALQLRFEQNRNLITWMIPIFVLSVPIFDTSLVMFSRIRRGVSPLTAGKDHASHRLVRIGLSQREAVMALYLVAGIGGMIAIFLTRAELLEAYVIGAIALIAAAYAIWRLDTVKF